MSAATATEDTTDTASAANKNGSLKEKWQWCAGNTSGCFLSVLAHTAIFFLKIAFRIESLEVVAVAAPWLKDPAQKI